MKALVVKVLSVAAVVFQLCDAASGESETLARPLVGDGTPSCSDDGAGSQSSREGICAASAALPSKVFSSPPAFAAGGSASSVLEDEFRAILKELCAPPAPGAEYGDGRSSAQAEKLRALAAMLDEKAAELQGRRRFPRSKPALPWSAAWVVLSILASVFLLFGVSVAIFKVYLQSLSELQEELLLEAETGVAPSSNRLDQKVSLSDPWERQTNSREELPSSPFGEQPSEDRTPCLVQKLYECQKLLSQIRLSRQAKRKGSSEDDLNSDAEEAFLDDPENTQGLSAKAALRPARPLLADQGREAKGESASKLAARQDEFEARCGLLFKRLREATEKAGLAAEGKENHSDVKAALCSSGAAETPVSEEEGAPFLLAQLQALFEEVDVAFASSRPAHVTAMIKCCNALLRQDGLATLKTCADTPELQDAAQRLIERVVPCIWSS